MTTTTRFAILSALLILAATTAAEEQHYIVTLEDGKTFETRYLPYALDDEPDVSHLLTDQGNWIALATPHIVDVEARHDGGGFGRQIETNARFLGVTWVEEDAEFEQDDESTTPPPHDLLEPATEEYSIDRFLGLSAIEPGDVGAGVPLDLFGYDEPYLFGSGAAPGYFFLSRPIPMWAIPRGENRLRHGPCL